MKSANKRADALVEELPARAELHDEEDVVVRLKSLVELHDVGVVQLAHDLHLRGLGDGGRQNQYIDTSSHPSTHLCPLHKK